MNISQDIFSREAPLLAIEEWVWVGGFSKVVATFNHVGGSLNLFMATTRDVWIIPSFLIWDHVLHVERISCVITNCGQHPFSVLNSSLAALLEENIRKQLSLSLDLFSKILLFQVTFIYSFLFLSFLLTFFRLVYYYSMWLYFSKGTN